MFDTFCGMSYLAQSERQLPAASHPIQLHVKMVDGEEKMVKKSDRDKLILSLMTYSVHKSQTQQHL